MNRSDAAKLVAVLVSAYPQQSARLDAQRLDAMVSSFAALLGDLTYEQANGALTVLVQTRAWMPSVADLRAAVLELARGPVKTGAEAWGSVLRAIGREGYDRVPGRDFVFADPVTAQVVAALGWASLCNSENPTADRARFIEAYDQIAANARRAAQAPALAAATERRQLGQESTPRQLAALIAQRLAEGNADA